MPKWAAKVPNKLELNKTLHLRMQSKTRQKTIGGFCLLTELLIQNRAQ